MKRFALFFGIAAGLVASCSVQEEGFKTTQHDDVIYYASFEQPTEEGTRVYANEDLLLRWTADDRVSIFGKNTYNQQYKFLGETGDNSGGFGKVDVAEYVTGNPISHTVSVYPYQEGTKISEEEVLTLTLPAEQHYAENTFGLGANTMVSVSADNFLQYKNVGGYLRLSLYGDGVSVSSITLKGNNGEKLAGKASVTMPLDGTPSAVLTNDAIEGVTLLCDTPVALGANAEESVDFWFVIPPLTFSKGFSIIVLTDKGLFLQSTEKPLTIERSKLAKMSSLEVSSQAKNIVYYTSSDGLAVYPKSSNWQNSVVINGIGIMTFNEDLTSVGNGCFSYRSNLTSMILPEGVKSIGDNAFMNCYGLTNISIPKEVETIGALAFIGCNNLTSINIPDNLTSFGNAAFYGCSNLSNISIPNKVTTISNQLFDDCSNLSSISIPENVTSIGANAFRNCSGLSAIVIPEVVTSIGFGAFQGCTGLTMIDIPDGVTSIGECAFSRCELSSFGGKYASTDGSFLINDSNILIAVATGGIQGAVNIPEGVRGIGGEAFWGGTSITSITLPKEIRTIGTGAFSGCSNLTAFTILAETPPACLSDILENTNNCPIYVPVGSVDAYKKASYWIDYADRIQPISSVPVPEAVDMGLPSGLKWASFNLGASKPEEYGDYYAWGEIEPYYTSLDPLTWKEGKENGYGWPSYRWCNGSVNTLTKYCNDSSYGYNGFTDDKTVLDPEDDAAHVNLGGNWRMPTYAEGMELIENCIVVWVIKNGVRGLLFTARNGNSIFLPESGEWVGVTYRSVPDNGNYSGYYMTSTLSSKNVRSAMTLILNNEGVHIDGPSRVLGKSIRPVYAE